VALEQMRRWRDAAVVFVYLKPIDEFASRENGSRVFKLLPVDMSSKFEDITPIRILSPADYPIMPRCERIATIAVPTSLASYHWRKDSPRYRRVAVFVDGSYISRVTKLQVASFDPKWKDVHFEDERPRLCERFSAKSGLIAASPIQRCRQ